MCQKDRNDVAKEARVLLSSVLTKKKANRRDKHPCMCKDTLLFRTAGLLNKEILVNSRKRRRQHTKIKPKLKKRVIMTSIYDENQQYAKEEDEELEALLGLNSFFKQMKTTPRNYDNEQNDSANSFSANSVPTISKLGEGGTTDKRTMSYSVKETDHSFDISLQGCSLNE